MTKIFYISIICIFTFSSCSIPHIIREDELQYAQAQYEQIIHRDSMICESILSGTINRVDARMLLRMQSDNIKTIRLYFDAIKR